MRVILTCPKSGGSGEREKEKVEFSQLAHLERSSKLPGKYKHQISHERGKKLDV